MCNIPEGLGRTQQCPPVQVALPDPWLRLQFSFTHTLDGPYWTGVRVVSHYYKPLQSCPCDITSGSVHRSIGVWRLERCTSWYSPLGVGWWSDLVIDLGGHYHLWCRNYNFVPLLLISLRCSIHVLVGLQSRKQKHILVRDISQIVCRPQTAVVYCVTWSYVLRCLMENLYI